MLFIFLFIAVGGIILAFVRWLKWMDNNQFLDETKVVATFGEAPYPVSTLAKDIAAMVGIPVMREAAIVDYIARMRDELNHVQLELACEQRDKRSINATVAMLRGREYRAKNLFFEMLNNNRIISDAHETNALHKRLTDWINEVDDASGPTDTPTLLNRICLHGG